MSIVVEKDSITVADDAMFILTLVLVGIGIFGIVLYHIYSRDFSPHIAFTGVFVFFFLSFISSLLAHFKIFLSGEDIFRWKVDRSGFYFQASRTHLFSLKKPVKHPWSNTIKVLHIKKFTAQDSDLDTVVYKDVILVFGLLSANRHKMLPYPGKIGLELFTVMRELASNQAIFEAVDSYTAL